MGRFDGQKSYVGQCRPCGKRAWSNRQAARNAIRSMRREDSRGMRPYRCPADDVHWHVGHLPESVMRGDIAARDIYDQREVS